MIIRANRSNVKPDILPPIIYKYTRLDEYFFQHLIKNELWFSKPPEFNDPYDCNICFAPKPVEGQRQFKRERYFIGHSHKPKIKVELIGENELINETKNQINKIGICCFSITNNNLLMWSHYSDAHRGVCIGYSVNDLKEVFGNIYKVKYGRTFPLVKFKANPFADVPTKIVTHKSIDWKYEKEIRIINASGLHTFKRKAIKEIIFGLNTPISQVRSIMALLFQLNYKHVELKQVIISDNEYKVKFRRLAPAEE
jgi:hypothetical protein